MWSDGSSAREGLASLGTTGEHTGLCRSAVECVPPLQEHELEGRATRACPVGREEGWRSCVATYE